MTDAKLPGPDEVVVPKAALSELLYQITHLAAPETVGGVEYYRTLVRRSVVAELRAMLTPALTEMTNSPKWQPIETAPMNTAVHIVLPDYHGNPTLTIGAKIDDGEGWLWYLISIAPNSWHYSQTLEWHDFECDDDYQPTHWMPLPEPPSTAAQGGG